MALIGTREPVRVHSYGMRTPSRFMPKLSRPNNGWQGWIALAFFGTCLLLVGYWALCAHPIVTSAVILLLAGLGVLEGRTRKRRLLALAAERDGESICDFARSFDPRLVDTWVVRAVYEQLQEYLVSVHPHFPVRASDRLQKVLIDDPDDLDMALAYEIAERAGRSLDVHEANPYFNKVVSVSDLVLFFNAQPIRPGWVRSERAAASF